MLSRSPPSPSPRHPSRPALPDLAPVAVDPNITAFLVLDINSAVCPPRPACIASVSAIARLLSKARVTGAFIGFSTTGTADVLSEVAPVTGGTSFHRSGRQVLQHRSRPDVEATRDSDAGAGRQRGERSDPVHQLWRQRAWLHGGGRHGRHFTGPEFDTYLAEYQLLNEPGFANTANDPLHANAVTLSRGESITFRHSHQIDESTDVGGAQEAGFALLASARRRPAERWTYCSAWLPSASRQTSADPDGGWLDHWPISAASSYGCCHPL